MHRGCGASFDHVAWHLYPRGTAGERLLDRFETTYRRRLGTHPVVCTEAGYFTAPHYNGGAVNLTEAEQARYLPQLLDLYVSRGYGISYFELPQRFRPLGREPRGAPGAVPDPVARPGHVDPEAGHAGDAFLPGRRGGKSSLTRSLRLVVPGTGRCLAQRQQVQADTRARRRLDRLLLNRRALPWDDPRGRTIPSNQRYVRRLRSRQPMDQEASTAAMDGC